MTTTVETRTISVGIARDWHDVYHFLSVPQNWPRWASGLGKSLRKIDGEWVAEGPDGPVKVRFSEPNPFGILDHYVIPAPGIEIYIPLRVIANEGGSEVIFTLFHRAGMTDEEFSSDAEWVERDLTALKALMESQTRPGA